MPNCKDCGIQLKDKRSKRCRICANLGFRNPAYGKKRSIEARLKTSLANKGNPACGWNKGKKHKIETIIKMSGRTEEKSPVWKGDNVGYRALHDWVVSRLGKADGCTNDPQHSASYFHWANISGEYKRDLEDWQSLCPRCNITDGIRRPDRFKERRVATFV